MGYEYGFEYAFPEAMEGAATGAVGIVTGILLVVWFLAMGFSLVLYVLNAVGMYRIAKRRGIHHAWLAWVPIGCNWLLGSISDHYQYVVKQKVTSRRKILLILSLVTVAVSFLMTGGVVAIAMASGSAADNLAFSLSIALVVIAYLAMMGLAIAHEIRGQVVFPSEPIIVNPQYGFKIERQTAAQYDYGEELTII